MLQHIPTRIAHIDFHTPPGITDFGRDWDAEAFAAQLKTAHVTHVNIVAKCNMGFSYFDTKIGTPYPEMHTDFYAEALAACEQVGIGVTAYFNFGLDQEMCRCHKEWCRVNEDGRVLDLSQDSNWYRQPCIASGYGDYLYALVAELLQKHPSTEGIFLDCVQLFRPCFGTDCLAAVKAEGGDPNNIEDVTNYATRQTRKCLNRLRSLAGNREFFCNGLPVALAGDINTYQTLECLPGTLWWDYEHFSVHAAEARCYSDRLCFMTGRFVADWGDFGGLKPKASLENDLWDGLMNGTGIAIGDHMHPAGGLDSAVWNDIGEVFAQAEVLEQWNTDAVYKAEVLLFLPEDTAKKNGSSYDGLRHMLDELHIPFNIGNRFCHPETYKMVILPESCRLNEDDAKVVSDFHLHGGCVISLGTGGLYADDDRFVLRPLKSVSVSMDPEKQIYYQPRDKAAEMLGTMVLAAYCPCIRMQCNDPSLTVLADTVVPYFSDHWDGSYSYPYWPPKEISGEAAAVLGHGIAHIAPNLGEAYQKYAYGAHRALLGYCFDALIPDPLVRCTGLPSTARCSVTENDTFTLLHIKITHPIRRGDTEMVEEHSYLPAGVTVSIRGCYPSAICVPDGVPLVCQQSNGRTALTLPEINGYLCVALPRRNANEEKTKIHD